MGGMPFRIRVTLGVLAAFALAVLVLPLVWPVPPLDDPRDRGDLAAPGDRFVEAAGTELRLRGASPNDLEPAPGATGALLLHGFAGNLELWSPWLDALAARGPAVAVDRLGFGLSERALAPGPYAPEAQLARVTALLDRLAWDRVVLIGHGSGAELAVRAATAHPDRAAGLVLIGPALDARPGPPRWLTSTPHFRRLGPLLMRRLGGASGEAFVRSGYADPQAASPRVLEAHAAATSVHDWDRALWARSVAPRASGVRAELAGIEAPALVLGGGADDVVPPAEAEAIADALPSGTWARLEDCGHAAPDECADAALAHVAAWAPSVPNW